MIKAAIIGASGYTGAELLRILALHPEVEVVKATSRRYCSKSVEEVFPALAGFYDGLKFSELGEPEEIKADVVFTALPHGVSQEVVPALLKLGVKVVDLGADFRLTDPAVYKEWYGDHKAASVIKDAVYGLPELHRGELKSAKLVANPGCYPTGAILALAPLVGKGLLNDEKPVVIDSKSGTSGAGRGANAEMLFSEVNEGFKAYKVGAHRHTPEMVQELTLLASRSIDVTFTPHLLPVTRGILTTAYVWLSAKSSLEAVRGLYADLYGAEPFVRLMPEGVFPDIKQVRGSNYCDIGLHYDASDNKVIAVSVIDNLVKGASGQAVQNMNIICGLDETTALNIPPISI